MGGKWIEAKIVTCSEVLEQVCGILYGMDIKGVAIEDPNDIYSGGWIILTQAYLNMAARLLL